MKIVIAIVVFNRYSNIEHWMKCWAQCDKMGAELVIIHTGEEIVKFVDLCQENNITYLHRVNQGFDIGCLQDVFRERLPGFPDYDYLLWVTDDTFPMRVNFLQPFIDAFKDPSVGVAAMQISKSVAPHFRTTGFMIRRETTAKIKFPVDPIKTKEHCYQFEHRSGVNTFTNQVRALGLSCVMVAPTKSSPMWDSAHPNARLRLDRQAEHDAVFFPERVPRPPTVTFICTIYNTYPQIVSSLLLQTYRDWRLVLIHDGPSSNGTATYIPDDPRITYIETPARVGNWGHKNRQWALKEIKEGRLSQPDFICIGNSDNYLVPVFCERMLSGFKNAATVATYTGSMVHSYKNWDVIPCRFERGYIDCAGVMVRANVACEIGWNDVDSHSADWNYFQDIAKRYGQQNFVKVGGTLLIHN